MKIRKTTVIVLSGTATSAPLGDGQWQAHPLHQYPDRVPRGEPRAPTGPRHLRELFVEIEAEDGTIGRYGPIYRVQAQLIRDELASFIEGRDAFATEALHDQMLRRDRHGRVGYYTTAVSAVDCALWDLKGKLLGQPVHRLLGGPTRERLPVYASMLGYSVEPERAAAAASEQRSLGYPAQKWFFAHGPASGERGLSKNLAMARAVRAAVGPDYPLMFDAFMGWDLPFALRMLEGLEELRPAWMEEPLPPEHLEGFRRLKAAHPSVPLATGEHVFGRHQTLWLLQSGAIDVLQNDPDWTGGLSEQLHICSLGSAYDIPVVAHGHSLLPALHIAAARSPAIVPYVEFLLAYQPDKQFFQAERFWPESGHLALPQSPGLGLELDPDRIESRQPFTD